MCHPAHFNSVSLLKINQHIITVLGVPSCIRTQPISVSATLLPEKAKYFVTLEALSKS